MKKKAILLLFLFSTIINPNFSHARDNYFYDVSPVITIDGEKASLEFTLGFALEDWKAHIIGHSLLGYPRYGKVKIYTRVKGESGLYRKAFTTDFSLPNVKSSNGYISNRYLWKYSMEASSICSLEEAKENYITELKIIFKEISKRPFSYQVLGSATYKGVSQIECIPN